MDEKKLQTSVPSEKSKKPWLIYLISIKYGPYPAALLNFRLRTIKPRISISGNAVAASSPILRLPPAISETPPTIVGLTVAPKSPARAKSANIAVPPLGHFWEERLIEPGHITPTETPQSAQPARPKAGKEDNDAVK